MYQPELSVFQIGREQAIKEGILSTALKYIQYDSLLLLEDNVDTAHPGPIQNVSSTFTPVPEYGIGRHGRDITGFGTMELSGYETTSVAVKKIDSADIRPQEDWDIEQVIAEEYAIAEELRHSEAPSFLYLGFIKKRRGFLTITQYEPSVKSFDAKMQSFDSEDVEKALSIAATTLIALHSRAIVHDDFIFENTAYDEITGQARTIDLGFSHHTEQIDLLMKNLNDYVRSLGTRYPTFGQLPVTPDSIDEHLVEPYLRTMQDTLPDRQKAQLLSGVAAVRKAVPMYIKG